MHRQLDCTMYRLAWICKHICFVNSIPVTYKESKPWKVSFAWVNTSTSRQKANRFTITKECIQMKIESIEIWNCFNMGSIRHFNRIFCVFMLLLGCETCVRLITHFRATFFFSKIFFGHIRDGLVPTICCYITLLISNISMTETIFIWIPTQNLRLFTYNIQPIRCESFS